MKLQVRASPLTARTKAPAAKKTKKQQSQFPSTNVPSPVRAPKQKIRSFAYNGRDEDEDEDEEEDAFDAPRHPSRKRRGHGYQADGFVVGDGDENEGFAPVREAKPLKATKAKGLGVPITTDERTAQLTELQSDVLRDFMTGAKQMRKSIQERKGHREAIFTDTVLREMGLDLPRNLDEMKTIPGIRAEMVDRYGKQFLPLINNTREFYGDEVPIPRNPQLRNRQAQVVPVVYEIDDDEEVEDQNHKLVYDLCGDSEEEAAEVPAGNGEDSGDESSYGGFDDDDDDDEEVHTSHHFMQNPEVTDFNNRYTQLGGGAAPTTKAAKKKKGTSRSRRTSGNVGRASGGVKKRAPKNGGGRASASGSTARRPSGGAGRGGGGASGGVWSNIMAMPT